MREINDDGTISILTVYTPKEALYYFLHEWEENPDTATVIKRIKYNKSPVVRLNLPKPMVTKSNQPKTNKSKGVKNG